MAIRPESEEIMEKTMEKIVALANPEVLCTGV